MEIISNDPNIKISEDLAADVAPSFVITDIKQAVRIENRVNIFINGKFDFSLDIAQVVDFRLKKGQALTEKELHDCRRASEFGKLYQRTLEYVLSRPHSIKETYDHMLQSRKKREAENRLRQKNLSIPTDDDIDLVLERLIGRGYLSDEKFVRYYIENRNVKKGISLKKLRQELAKKGVSQSMIEAALAENPRDEAEEIKKIIAKKRRRYDDEKLIQYLLRQGFDYQQSKDAVLEMGSQSSE